MPTLVPGYYSAARLTALARAFRDMGINAGIGFLEAELAPEDPEPGRHGSAERQRRELEAGA
jgi:hypothetical protein